MGGLSTPFPVHHFGTLVLLTNGSGLAMAVQLFWSRRLFLFFRYRVFGLGFALGSLLGLVSLLYFCNGLYFDFSVVDLFRTCITLY